MQKDRGNDTIMLRKLGLGFLSICVLVAALAIWRADDIRRLLAVNSLFSAEHIVSNFSSMDTMFHARSVPVSGEVEAWPRNEAPLPEVIATSGQPLDVQAYLQSTTTTSLIVILDGAIVHESYYLGTGEEDLRISWSMAKSMLSVAIGVAVDNGLIDLDRTVDSYVPSLAGSAYEGATVRNVLNMASGVRFNEDYLDFWSDINKMGRVLAIGGSMDGFAAEVDERDREPGSARQYISIDTHVAAMVLRAATGQDLPDYIGQTIFSPIGLEREPYYVTDENGVAFALGGMNMTTRDYARFGQMVLDGGQWAGVQVVPEEWIEQSTAPSAPTATRNDGFDYGYQWWIPEGIEGVILARGVYGQFIWIDRNTNSVIVKTSGDRNFRQRGAMARAVAFFNGLTTHYAGRTP
ncbi:MAG: serine hydrolase [Pseudomonadota bacterium]